MAETSLTDRVLDTLVDAGLLTAEQLSSVRGAAVGGVSVGRVLTERGLVSSADVGNALEAELGVPRVDLSSYTPDEEALALMPAQVARSRRLLPLFEIDGAVTIAVGDPMNVLDLDDVAAELHVEFDPVLTDPEPLLAAITQYYGEPESGPAPVQVPSAPVAVVVPPETGIPLAPVAHEAAGTIEQIAAATPAGASAVDLDVLAVADSVKVSLLVTDILIDAASRGATRVQLLPYKDDFFLVYRVGGRLEKVASAPLSLQSSLVDGFKNFVRIGAAGSNLPATGRVRAHLAGQDLVLVVSVVPTISGQRLVVSLAPHRAEPRGVEALGLGDAETRALHVMVERGRGILLIASPAAEGRSATYYALLAHAAAVGKTVFSVERSIEHEIPAVAQVLVSPGSPVGPAAYLAAGSRQDTDVIAIDGLATGEEVSLAVEAAAAGRLVIATVVAAGIVPAVRVLLDLGAEPYGLSSALTLAIGQRLVRVNCPNCGVEKPSPAVALLPGAPAGLVSKSGSGCPNCGQSGFAGVTGIFEVLPFSDPVRMAVARGADAEALTKAALAAGMRPLVTSGIAKVAAGLVSADELDRVLRLPR